MVQIKAWVIQAIDKSTRIPQYKYYNIDTGQLVSDKAAATSFISGALARGYMVQARVLFRTHKFSLIAGK